MLEICRLCGDRQPVIFNIFGSDGKMRNLQSKIKINLDIDITFEDILSKAVCNVCCERLEFYAKFYAKCHATQETLMRNCISKPNTIKEMHSRGESNSGRFMKIKKRTPTSLSFSGLVDKIASKTSRATLSSLHTKISALAVSSQPSVTSFKSNSTFNDASSSIVSIINVDCQNETLSTFKSSSTQSKRNPSCGLQIPTYVSIKDSELVSFVPVKIKRLGDQLSCQVAIPRYNSQKPQKVSSGDDATIMTNKLLSQEIEKGSPSVEVQIPCANLVKLPKRRLIRIPASKSVIANVEKISSTVHRCKLCGASFKHNFQCEYHVRRHIGEESFVCNICNKRFVARYLLVRHQRSHEKGFPYVCQKCNRGFRSSFSLKTHDKTHLDEPAPFRCNICQREFYIRNSYVGHMTTHDGERERIRCGSCKKTYISKRHLKEHIERVHNRVTRHFCSTCNKGFYRNSTLKLHERLHTSERPHSCDVCGHSFNEKINLERHKKVHIKKNAVLNQDKSVLYIEHSKL